MTRRLLLCLLPCLSACSDGDEGESWTGTCTISSAPVIGHDLDLTIELNGMVVVENASLANSTGTWAIYNGDAVVDEAGTRSSSVGEIFRCDSASGCANQGDPYGQGETLFQVRAGGSQPQDIIMKGTPEPDDAGTYSGICQTRRSGVNLSGTFSLSRN